MARLCRIVLRGACTEEHEERLRRALSDERFFSSFVVDDAHTGRDVEAMVSQLEAAVLNGWRHPSYPMPVEA